MKIKDRIIEGIIGLIFISIFVVIVQGGLCFELAIFKKLDLTFIIGFGKFQILMSLLGMLSIMLICPCILGFKIANKVYDFLMKHLIYERKKGRRK